MNVKIDDLIFDRVNYDAGDDVLYRARGTRARTHDIAASIPKQLATGTVDCLSHTDPPLRAPPRRR